MGKTKARCPYQVAAIISLDPAGVGPSGVAVRLTATLGAASRLTLRYPDFVYEGNVFEPAFHDALSVYLADNVPQGHRALLAVEDSAYRSYSVARHIGRGIGCLEGLLHDLNVAAPVDTQYFTPKVWRTGVGIKGAKREDLKLAARTYVSEWYEQDVGEDLAESVAINDFVCLNRSKLWGAA